MTDEHRVEGESGLDGLLCPVCGQVSARLPVVVHRFVDDWEERFHVCSAACHDLALRSPHVQTNLFGRNLAVWSRSVQGEFPFADGKDGNRGNGGG